MGAGYSTPPAPSPTTLSRMTRSKKRKLEDDEDQVKIIDAESASPAKVLNEKNNSLTELNKLKISKKTKTPDLPKLQAVRRSARGKKHGENFKNFNVSEKENNSMPIDNCNNEDEPDYVDRRKVSSMSTDVVSQSDLVLAVTDAEEEDEDENNNSNAEELRRVSRVNDSGFESDSERRKNQKSFFEERTTWTHKDFHQRHKIGSGGFSTVYKAAVKGYSDAKLALKYVNKDTLANLSANSNTCAFLQESNLHRTLQHDNIVRAFGFFRTTKHAVLVMECCKGDLQDYLCGKGFPLNKFRGQQYIKQIAEGLKYLHLTARIIHMDLKLENILVSENDVLKITDFGFSIKIRTPRKINYKSRGGTRWYKPPEQLQYGYFDSTADIWAFGCIAFEIILLYHPFFTTERMDEPDYDSEKDEPIALSRMIAAQKGEFRNSQQFQRECDYFQEFIRTVLTYARTGRPTAKQLDSITWLTTWNLDSI